jgi:hypothetical protein
VISTVVTGVAQQIVVKLLYTPFSKYVKDQTDPELNHKRTLKASTKFFNAFYFVFTSIVGYYTLRDTIWLPWWLGGRNADAAITNVFVNYPFTPHVEGAKNYAILTMGYHASDFFYHILFKERGNDFTEMLLHHICAFSLFALMIQVNLLGVGCLVVYCHDLSDIWASAAGGVSQFKHSGTASAVMLVFLITSWIYTRIFGLSQLIYATSQVHIAFEEIQFGYFVVYFCNFMLCCLFVLHIYWLVLIL